IFGLFTLIVVYDFFPNLIGFLNIEPRFLTYLILGLVLISLFIPRYRIKKEDKEEDKSNRISNFFPFIYIFCLIGFLFLLGGHSTSGVINGISISIFVLLLIIEIIKVKKSV
ncbi:hypothetical protein, partial [Cytobacillus sp. FSL R5-0596]|uniref:hypothetical protein n=1 Tax=Cytobacillus sp. FSL R5-0596 TaxID=2954696 RepID=UPI0030F6EEDE